MSNASNFFLVAIVAFIISALDEYAIDNYPAYSVPNVEQFSFLVGLLVMGFGFVFARDLRKLVHTQPTSDPPPFGQAILLIMILAINILFLFSFGQSIPYLNVLGWSLIVLFCISLLGGVAAFFTWEEKDIRHNLALGLVVIPYIFLIGIIVLSYFGFRLP